MDAPYFKNRVPSRWTLRFFPVFCHYRQCHKKWVYANVLLNLFEYIAKLPSIGVILIYIPTGTLLEAFIIRTSNWVSSGFASLPRRRHMVSWCSFILPSLIMSEVKQLFLCLRAICISFSVDCPYYLLSILLLGCWFFSYLFLGTPCISKFSPLSVMWVLFPP